MSYTGITRTRNPRPVCRGTARGGTARAAGQPRVPGQTTASPWQEPRQPPSQLSHSDPVGGARPEAPSASCTDGSCPGGARQTESHQAYTVIPPNEQKRRSIMEKAKAEEDNYRRYKETQKMGYVSCGGTVGGASCAPVRPRQRNSTFNSKQKSTQYKEDERRREAEDVNRKKMEQRRKAERNEREEKERQDRLKQDHRRVNSAFLRALERR